MFRHLAPILLAYGLACTGTESTDAAEATPARLTPSLTIDAERAPLNKDYEFGFIADALEARDGTIWVLDGAFADGRLLLPTLRQFDSTGAFIRRVGGEGSGPGEFRDPLGLAVLSDGRVAVRSNQPPAIVIYKANGTFDTTWSIGAQTRWHTSGPNPIGVDTAGVMWLIYAGRLNLATHDRVWGGDKVLRLSPNGSILDTIPMPDLPRLNAVTVTRGTATYGTEIPYHPRWVTAWSPVGTFATALTDQYRIHLRAPPGVDTTAIRTITWHAGQVPISEKERTARDVRNRAWERKHGVSVPEISRTKPPIRSLRFADDGRLLVGIHRPSRQVDDQWTEELAFDVFEADGQFVGRLILPDSFRILRLTGNRLLGVTEKGDGDHALERFEILWR